VPYTLPFIQFRLEGHFGSGVTDKKEIWSAGLHIGSASLIGASSSTILAFLTAVAPAANTLHSTAAVGAGSNCFLDSLSGALIGTNGKYALGSLQTTTRYTYPTPVFGSGTATGPWSQAMAWSLRSAILRGPGSHGRMFYPALALSPVSTTGVLATAATASYAAAAVAFINTVNTQATAAFGANTNVSLVSPIGTGFQSTVTRVGIGGRLDTQESRENKLLESYAFSFTTVAASVLEESEDEFLKRLADDPDFKRGK
jgi:hypothetical protein